MKRPVKTHKTNCQPTQRYMRYLLLQQRKERCDAELVAWIEKTRARSALRSANPAEWTIEQARECADGIRAYDEIMHRHGCCSRDRDCLACEALMAGAT